MTFPEIRQSQSKLDIRIQLVLVECKSLCDRFLPTPGIRHEDLTSSFAVEGERLDAARKNLIFNLAQACENKFLAVAQIPFLIDAKYEIAECYTGWIGLLIPVHSVLDLQEPIFYEIKLRTYKHVLQISFFKDRLDVKHIAFEKIS